MASIQQHNVHPGQPNDVHSLQHDDRDSASPTPLSEMTANDAGAWSNAHVEQCFCCQCKAHPVNPWFVSTTEPLNEASSQPATVEVGDEWMSWDYTPAGEPGQLLSQQFHEANASRLDDFRGTKTEDDVATLESENGRAIAKSNQAWMTSMSETAMPRPPDDISESKTTPVITSSPVSHKVQPTIRPTRSSDTSHSSTTERSHESVSPCVSSATEEMSISDFPESFKASPESISHPSPSDDRLPCPPPTRAAAGDLAASQRVRKSRLHQREGHSVCEKRYRNKLNLNIETLRTKVPSLRPIAKKSEDYAYREGGKKQVRPAPATKFDKATIVAKAIEYIVYLEKCNACLSAEEVLLKDRVAAIKKLAMADKED